ncbi:MAG: segregation/condensation protein A [Candidatus Azambacteria bacterium]|nr:segregation/condensation protein A [Candidatus Azambacteria bacterium]
MYQVNLTKFNGPLDILFSLIEEKKMAINEISLSAVTDQFLEYLKKFEENIATSDVKNSSTSDVNMTEYQRTLADFLVVASRLILIKSRSLLPNLVLSQEEEGDIKELEERLKAYQQIKIWGRELGKWAKSRPLYLSRESYLNLPIIFYPPKNIYPDNLAEIYKKFLKTLPQIEKLEEKNLQRVVTLEQKIQELKTRINTAIEASFADISNGVKTKIDIILSFLAILMLFRSRILELSQDKLFGDIKIKQCVNS